MSKATFYEHFDNKEDCIVALFDAGAEAVIEAMRQRGRAGGGRRPGRPRAGHRPHLPGGARGLPGRGADPAGGDHRRRAAARSSGATARSPSTRARSTTHRRGATRELGGPCPRAGLPASTRSPRRGGGGARVAPAAHGRAARLPTSSRWSSGSLARPARRGRRAGNARRVSRCADALRARGRPAAAAARAWSSGASAWRARSARRSATRTYWGRPIPGFGDPAGAAPVLGLAPAAHGGNRTGRVFTGDRSGDFLFAGLHRAGFANQPTSRSRDDGLALTDCCITAAVRCAPPPTSRLPAERDACAAWLGREVRAPASVRVVLCLGGFAWDAACACARGWATRRRARSRASGTAPSAGRAPDPAGLLPPVPAEHVHRAA